MSAVAAETPSETPLRDNGRGGKLRTGNPGNRGGGRPPDEFKRMCRELASRAKTLAQIKKILANPNHPMFMSALKWASEHGYGKPTQPIGIDPTQPITFEVTHRIVDPKATAK